MAKTIKTPAATPTTIQIEKMGKTQTWKINAGAYAGKREHRQAYEAGYQTRSRQFNAGDFSIGCPKLFASEALQQAYADGYDDAAKQDDPKYGTSKRKAKARK